MTVRKLVSAEAILNYIQGRLWEFQNSKSIGDEAEPELADLILRIEHDLDEMMEEMAGDSKEEVMEMQELFDKHDEDGDGYLTLKELEGLIRESGDETWAEKEGNWWSDEVN